MADERFSEDLARIAGIDAVRAILDIVCRTTGMGFSAVARVTEDRWIACAVNDQIGFGLKPGGELEVKTTICDEIRASGVEVVIDHVAEDPLFREHHTPRTYGLQSYISMPIVLRDGSFFGTLCAIDPNPHKVSTPETVGMFKLFAELIAMHLDAQDRLAASQADLVDARHAAELRDQFIAVLGHDLRNPIASIDAGARILQRGTLDDKSANIVQLMQKSVTRMANLIDNILDFARGRLGDGLSVQMTEDPRLEDALRHVVAELGAAHAGRSIVVDIDLKRAVKADTHRLCQLLSNLLGNALTHGAPEAPVTLSISTDADQFILAVNNAGEPIAPDTMNRLFLPFTRARNRSTQEGLGLGLYIASEIARAHGGRLDATSTPEQTCFIFRMPLAAGAARSAASLEINA